MQLDFFDLLERPVMKRLAAITPKRSSNREIIRNHLSQRPFWTLRGFHMAVAHGLELNGITQIALAAEIGARKNLISRACRGRSVEAAFKLADALGYTYSGPRDEGATFKAKREAA